MPFDAKKPYGVVSPPTNGCFYYQNGAHYDVHYNEVDFNTGNIIAKAPHQARPQAAVGPEKLAAPKPKKKEAVNTSAGEQIDLEAWARGEITNLRFFQIKHACTKLYGKTPNTADEAKALIQGV